MTALRSSLLLIAGLLLNGCQDDTVTSLYRTRAQAEADNLFDRGWLPGFIPPSSSQIVTHNDLDLNLSEGEFSFSPHLRKLSPEDVSGTDLVRFLERSYEPCACRDGDSEWTFFINVSKGHCQYRMGRPPSNGTD